MRRRMVLIVSGGIAGVLALAAGARAQVPGVPPPPIPGPTLTSHPPTFLGAPAIPKPIEAPAVPQNPFMAPNGRSNIHDDAYMTDTYEFRGPLGHAIGTASALFFRECASVTFDARGRIVTICVGLDRPELALLDPRTLEPLATFALPPRRPSGNPFSDFSGGGYFYLDNHDRAVIPTSNHRVYVVAERAGRPGFRLVRQYDLRQHMAADDAIISVLPDWSGRLWFATREGEVGTVDPASGAVRAIATGEPIGNSFAVDETGGVFIVSDAALYRFDAGPGGRPVVTWREPYPNIGTVKPGQTEAGSGTTPTLLGSRDDGFVAITDNADPMDVLVYRRAASVAGSRLVCSQPVFTRGASDTDQSLIGVNHSLIVENNYGYSVAATENGGTTAPGIARVDFRPGGGCRVAWTSDVRAPSVVPKLSLANGLVYTYTKPEQKDGTDPWYFTALDFRTGRTVYSRLAGVGLGYNNNYAPVTLSRPGIAYVGVLGGITLFRDGG